jgi:hypothetical protein
VLREPAAAASVLPSVSSLKFRSTGVTSKGRLKVTRLRPGAREKLLAMIEMPAGTGAVLSGAIGLLTGGASVAALLGGLRAGRA